MSDWNRDFLIKKLNAKCQADIAKAESVRDTAIAEIKGLSSETLRALASAYEMDSADDSGDHDDTFDPCDPGDDEKTTAGRADADYGKVVDSVRRIVADIPGQFTVRSILAVDNSLNPTSVAGVLKKLEGDLVTCVLRGSGRRPSIFEKKSSMS